MSTTQKANVAKQNTGFVTGIIACILAVCGILFFGIIFIPLAALVAVIGTIIAIMNINIRGILVNILAWVLTIIGLMTSPLLLGAIGAIFL